MDCSPPLLTTLLGPSIHRMRIVTAQVSDEKFCSNEIRTSHYTPYNFVFKNLWQQFQRAANVYFLLIGCLQLDVFFPGLSPTHWSTTIGPLFIVLSINAIKEIYDDYFRHRSDAVVNSSVVEVVAFQPSTQLSENDTCGSRGGGLPTTKWRDLSVGDIVRVKNNNEFPADIVMISSSDPQGLCFVETANLDGESNLKVKSATDVGLPFGVPLASWQCDTEVQNLKAKLTGTKIECETPNNQLYKFEGKWVGLKAPPASSHQSVGLDDDVGLSVDNILLRGSTLRNTEWVIGVVVFTGADTKLMRNMIRAPHKVSQLERHMNLLVISIGIFQTFCCVLLAALQEKWFQSENTSSIKHWYLLPTYEWPDIEGGFKAAMTQFIRFLILLQALIPISLYVTLELVKVIQCAWISFDRQLWDPAYGVRCGVRTTTLNEELGQVQCVLSDKTGTLTENVMAFVKCSINGIIYAGDAMPWAHLDDGVGAPGIMGNNKRAKSAASGASSVHTITHSSALRAATLASDPSVTSFLSHLATCHTVVPAADDSSGKGVGGLQYQASSPDEEALVTGAALMGRRLTSNANGKIVVEIHPAHGSTAATAIGSGAAPAQVMDILAINEFSSARKRMSVVTRDSAGTVKLLLKGADVAVLSRLRADHDQASLNTVQSHLDAFAREGLRTLVLAEKTLTEEEYADWIAVYREASCALTDREDKLSEAAELIERDCELVGATAVEDKLQEGAPDTIAKLRAAGMLVWMLTGDKLETAVSIAHTCRLIDADGDLVVLQESDFSEGRGSIFLANKAREALEDRHAGGEFGLVIEGGALQYALLEENQDHFLNLCSACTGVVCCRVSPMQKAHVTSMMKDRAGMITLAVGDGANDVGMIKAAHIGVGISGREGRAAVLASDFSIGQFHFLARLLLIHGRWSAKRNREVVMYAFYKNFVYAMANMWFGFFSAYSAQPIFTTAAIATFNVLWTSLPTVAFACFDQDVTSETVMSNPQLYLEMASLTGRDFLVSAAWWLTSALWHSLWCFFAVTVVLGDAASTTQGGQQWDVWAVGVAVITCVIITCNVKVALRTNTWTVFNFVAIFGSIFAWFPFLAILGSAWTSFGVFGTVAAVHVHLLPEPRFWLALVLSVGGSCIADVFVESFHRQVRPADYEIMQETEAILRRAGFGGKDAGSLPLHAPVPCAFHVGCSSGGKAGNERRARRKSRNPSVMEVMAQHKAESLDWCP